MVVSNSTQKVVESITDILQKYIDQVSFFDMIDIVDNLRALVQMIEQNKT